MNITLKAIHCTGTYANKVTGDYIRFVAQIPGQTASARSPAEAIELLLLSPVAMAENLQLAKTCEVIGKSK